MTPKNSKPARQQTVRVTKTATEDDVHLQEQIDTLSFVLMNRGLISPRDFNAILKNKLHFSKKE